MKLPSTWQVKELLVIASMAILAFVALTIFYWSVSSHDVLEIKNAPIPVRTIRQHPTADGVVILRVDFCKKVAANGRVRTSFVSQTREVLLPISTDRGAVGCQNVEVPILIPHEIPPGEYVVRFRVIYQVNPIKEVIEEFDSKKFKVVE